MNSGLGGVGDPSDDYCVNDESPFSKGKYRPYRDCPPQNNNGNCCLKRSTRSYEHLLSDAIDFADLFAENPNYVDFGQSFRT